MTTAVLFCGLYCLSQQIVVVDEATRQPVPYANCFLSLNGEPVSGTYCDEHGRCTVNSETSYDKITVTSVGYDKLEQLKTSNKIDTLSLKRAVYPLKEILLTAKKSSKISALGYYNANRKSLLGASKGFEICTFIANPFAEQKQIKSFQFRIRNQGKAKLGFKLHCYKMDLITRSPGSELLTQDIVVIGENLKKEKIEIDVEQYNIVLPVQGAFIGIEWLGNLNEETNDFENKITQNGYIELNDDVDQNLTFTRNRLSVFPWIDTTKFKSDVAKYSTFDNIPNASFAIKVFE